MSVNIYFLGLEWIELLFAVSLMLPGGISVLGVYFADDNIGDQAAKSGTVDKCLSKIDSALNTEKEPRSYLSMTLDKSSGNIGCEIVAFADGTLNKVRKSADVGETEPGFRWQVVKSKFLLDYPIVFQSGPESDQPIFQKVKLALKMVENNLNLDSSNILFNNTFRSKPEEFLDEKLVKEEFKKLNKTPTKRPTEPDDEDDDYLDDAPVKEYTAEILLDPEFQKASGRTALLFCQFEIY